MIKASDINDTSRSILHVLDDGIARTAMELNVGTGFGVRPIRRALAELHEFNLVMVNINERRFKVFSITGEGKRIVDELHPKSKDEIMDEPVMAPVKIETNHQIYDDMKRCNPNIVSWLRMQADSFLLMAKQLETYED